MTKVLSRKVLLVHPGVQHSPILAAQLNRLNLLDTYISGAIFSKDQFLTKILLRIPLVKILVAPRIYDIGSNNVNQKCFYFIELYYVFLNRFRLSSKKKDIWLERNLSVQRRISNEYFQKADYIIGFDTASSIIALNANTFNKTFILDVTTAHPLHKLKIMQKGSVESKENNIDGIETFSLPANYFIEEYTLASRLVTASSFVKNGLVDQGVPENKIVINPYGVDTKMFYCKHFEDQSGPIKILYVGNISEFKGIRNLISAIMYFKNTEVTLTLVGWGAEDFKVRNPDLNYESTTFYGKVAKHQLADIYRSHDVFIFPSLIDGFGLVILEAMSSGLPVIASTNSAGPDLITNNKNGFVFDPFLIDDLVSHIDFFVKNRSAINTMGASARLTAESYTWEAYGERWAELINCNICK